MKDLDTFKQIIRSDEEPLKIGPANYFKHTLANVGGKLLLTDKRLLFKSHRLFQSNTELVIDINDVTKAVYTGGIGASNQITVFTHDNQYRFVLYEGMDWVNTINDLIRPKDDGTQYLKELEGLKKLLDDGVITEDEFLMKKKQILGL